MTKTKRLIKLPRRCTADLINEAFEAAVDKETLFYWEDKSTEKNYHHHVVLSVVDTMVKIHLDFSREQEHDRIYLKVFLAQPKGKFFQEYIGMPVGVQEFTIQRIIHNLDEEIKKRPSEIS